MINHRESFEIWSSKMNILRYSEVTYHLLRVST